MYLIIERQEFDLEKNKYVFSVKSYDDNFHNAQKKKQAFETINENDNVSYSIVSFVDKQKTKVA
jgi:hypothetical protein